MLMRMRLHQMYRVLRQAWIAILIATQGERLRVLRIASWCIWITPAMLMYLLYLATMWVPDEDGDEHN